MAPSSCQRGLTFLGMINSLYQQAADHGWVSGQSNWGITAMARESPFLRFRPNGASLSWASRGLLVSGEFYLTGSSERHKCCRRAGPKLTKQLFAPITPS